MEENKEIKTSEAPSATEPKEEQVQAIKTSEFMKETIKQRPINKRKLMRRLLLTVLMAVVFGLVACVTFLFLEPVINTRINPEKEEEPSTIVFVEETAEEETKPEDMIADETELTPVIIEQAPLDDEQIEQVLNEMELGINDYIALSDSVTTLAGEVSKSVVDVIGIGQDTDWINNEYEEESVVSGVLIADNGIDYLVLANTSGMKDVDSFEVKFCDGGRYKAEVKMQDMNSGLSVLSVRKAIIRYTTHEVISLIEMGTTLNRNLNGSPVMALGRPLGSEESLCLGHITGSQGEIIIPDARYQAISTDIIGSVNASGILVNMYGQLMGIIDMTQNSQELQNMIRVIGISDIKRLIERLSNGYEIPYLGLYCEDISEETSNEMGLPKGVYITSLNLDSPALEAGIKGGDVIVKFAGSEISSFQGITRILQNYEPEQIITIEVKRQGLDGYTSLEYQVTLAHQQHTLMKQEQ